jgi:hypothetical protein
VVAVVVVLLADEAVADREDHAALGAHLGAGEDRPRVDREHAGPGRAGHDPFPGDEVVVDVDAVLAQQRPAADEGGADARGVAAAATGGDELRALGEPRVRVDAGVEVVRGRVEVGDDREVAFDGCDRIGGHGYVRPDPRDARVRPPA